MLTQLAALRKCPGCGAGRVEVELRVQEDKGSESSRAECQRGESCSERSSEICGSLRSVKQREAHTVRELLLIGKMLFLSQLIYRFITITIPADFYLFIFIFLLDIDNLDLKFIQKCREPEIAKSSLKKQPNVDFRTSKL